MNRQDYVSIVERFEQKAATDPKGYRWHVLRVALLGYAYILGAIAVLLLLVVGSLWLLIALRTFVLIKLVFIMLIPIGLILKSMWVKFTPPEGIRVKSREAPALFQAINEVRVKTGGPPIHEVLLRDDCNCAVTQLPRLGMFGFYKNYLMLGLPLMDALPTDQFKAVLAHEMGHLSGEHGKFGSWVYHVLKSWEQILANLSEQNAFGTAVIYKFAVWFVPYFDAHTLALRRAHEYAADQISARAFGADVCAEALLNVHVRGNYLTDAYWPDALKAAESLPEPPSDVFVNQAAALKSALDEAKTRSLLKVSLLRHDVTDSHPALTDRIRALQPDKDVSNIEQLACTVAAKPIGTSAAEALFGSSLNKFRAEVQTAWLLKAREGWHQRYKYIQKAKVQSAELTKKLEDGTLSSDEAISLAQYAMGSETAERATEIHNKLLAKFPESPDVHFLAGMHLLQQENDAGIEHLKKAQKLDASFGHAASAVIADYLRNQGRSEEADDFAKQSEDFANRAQTSPGVLVGAMSVGGVPQPQPSFFRRYRSNIILACVVCMMGFFAVSTFDRPHVSADPSAEIDSTPGVEVEQRFIARSGDHDRGKPKPTDVYAVYMQDVERTLKANYNPPKDTRSRRVVVAFQINSDGTLGKQIRIKQGSGSPALDRSCIQTVRASGPFKPLPAGAPESVDIDFTFDYNVYQH